MRRLLTMRMMTMMTLLIVTLVLQATAVAGYCAGLGANPGFRGPPKVEQVWGFQEAIIDIVSVNVYFQVSLTSVQVSWHGLATRAECADQFIVKSWLARNPNDYKMSDLLQTSQYSFVVEDLLPNQDYVFQVEI